MFLEAPWITNCELELSVSVANVRKLMLPEKWHHLQTHPWGPCPRPAGGMLKPESTNDEFGNNHMGTSVTQGPVLSDGTGQLTILHTCATILTCQASQKRSATSLVVSRTEKLTVSKWRIKDCGTADIRNRYYFNVWGGFELEK